VDAGLRTVAFLPIHTDERHYPVAIGAVVACRTIRRFLEHFPKKLDLIVFCFDNSSYFSAYRDTLALFMPRSQAEAVAASSKLAPEDIGNEWGESASEERQIRIGALPGMSADSGYEDDDDDEAPRVVSSAGTAPALPISQKKPSPDVRAKASGGAGTAQGGVSGGQFVAPEYSAMLSAAQAEDFADLEQR
jgi:hypothetical protein